MRKIVFFIAICAVVYSCGSFKDYKTISIKQIEFIEVSSAQTHMLFNKKKLEGKWRIKYGNGESSISCYKNGLLEGEKVNFSGKYILSRGCYKEGLKHGEFLFYVKGREKEKRTYNNGFLNGTAVWYSENEPLDTVIVCSYKSDSISMHVYIDKMTGVFKNECLFELIDPCLIKAQEYPIRYYSKEDSSFIAKKVWYKIDNCIYQSKEWGYSGAD